MLDAARQTSADPQSFDVLWRQDSAEPGSACLTLGFPSADDVDSPESRFYRLVWWPKGLCVHRRVAIISSRVGAKKHQLVWWFDLLRTAVLRVCPENECLMCVDATTTHESLYRSAELFGVPRLNVKVHDTSLSQPQLKDWLRTRLEADASPNHPEVPDWNAEVLPRLATNDEEQDAPGPLRDRLNVMLAQRCYALSIRGGGHLHGLLTEQLAAPAKSAPLVFLAGRRDASSDVQRDLVDRGAVAWLVEGVADSRSQKSISHHPGANSDDCIGPLAAPEEWLCHWTRPCAGEWPGQSRTDYLDELILGCSTNDRSALASLLRIVSHAEILASHVRRETYAVSFTEVPLQEFRSRRVYRRHRRRYDFESWGIAVRRDSLEKLGARPVQYGSPKSAESQHAEDDVWYHPETDQSGTIDWRVEREWRLPTSLNLNDLPPSSVCVFVNSPGERDVVRSACNWQVVVVPSTPKQNAPSVE